MAGIPNFVVIFLDDSGWADFRPFGDTDYPTPNVEQLAADGCRFDQFYVPQAICSASRAALLTGCYPERTKVFGALSPRVRGLDPSMPVLSEVLKQRGYATGFFGKWHIGDHEETRPPARGFDESAGLMYSNDMWKHHPESRWFDQFELQYWESGNVVIDDVSPEQQRQLTTWATEYAVDFIKRHGDEPFFLYVPHNMPHVPIFCSDKFEGKSGCGLYADVMMEIDWSVGQIRQALVEAGVDDNTLIVFTSDNGPWISYGNHAGRTPFREAKGTSFDGGTRSACIMAWPGRIAAGGACSRAFCSVDLLPTFANLAGAPLPESPIDGVDVWPLISGDENACNPHDYYPFSTGRTFEGVISGDGKWKLHLPHSYRKLVRAGCDGEPGEYGEGFIELSLFDMENDPYETTNVAEEHPEIVARLKAWAEQHRARWYGEDEGE
ncbi:MAG: sulfatase [Candidatus Pacebacteria bacterium]|nr:sulfatase [Candidatus Paceibacterota bacterium]